MTLCPSAPCEEGALIIGRALRSDVVALLPHPIPVSSAFVAEAVKHRAPEKRFRFASPCRGGGCLNWNGHNCLVPDQMRQVFKPNEAELPECGIRADCRWHHQDGLKACSLCVNVTTQRDAE